MQGEIRMLAALIIGGVSVAIAGEQSVQRGDAGLHAALASKGITSGAILVRRK